MNPTWPAVDNLWDLVGNLWIGMVVIAAAVIPSWFAARNHKSIKDIKDQVVNGHENPMRFDLDRVIQAVDDLRHDVRTLRKDLMAERHDVRTLREDLMAEADHRRIQITDLRTELDRRKHR